MLKWIKWLGFIYIFAVGISFAMNLILSFFMDYGPRHQWSIECYYYDALLIGIKCQNFFGESVVELFLNLPLYQIYSLFWFYWSIEAFMLSLAMWVLPILYILIESKIIGGRNA
jgi:hypothetical protein